MSNNILFILEGADKEKSITDNLIKFFVNENTIITCAYCTTIYKMYQDISDDDDLDTFNLLKEIETNKETLKNFRRSDFAEIYMFFDYDGHATNASNTKLSMLLDFFDAETEKGKLYISYPMVEALKHIENFDTFKDLKVSCNSGYKKTVHINGIDEFKDFKSYDFNIWKKLIDAHLKKMNMIINDLYEFPTLIVEQSIIFNKQLEKYINIDLTVAVLSAFPIFLHDYYGNIELKKRLE